MINKIEMFARNCVITIHARNAASVYRLNRNRNLSISHELILAGKTKLVHLISNCHARCDIAAECNMLALQRQNNLRLRVVEDTLTTEAGLLRLPSEGCAIVDGDVA